MSHEEKIALFENLESELKFNCRRMLLEKARLGRSVIFADSDGQPRRLKAKKALADLLHRAVEVDK